ncbi:hypothetical protein ACOI9X_02145 [Pseudomonas sp. P2757]|uniref:hypothetical protein n=1 Tax=unclassified Pseudomonas TaxID=196821 RepID=UPI003B5AF57E
MNSARTYKLDGNTISAGHQILMKRSSKDEPNIRILEVASVEGKADARVVGRDLTATEASSPVPGVAIFELQAAPDFSNSVSLRINDGSGQEDRFTAALDM